MIPKTRDKIQNGIQEKVKNKNNFTFLIVIFNFEIYILI